MKTWFKRWAEEGDLAIDLGTAVTRVWGLGGLTLELPTPVVPRRSFLAKGAFPAAILAELDTKVRWLQERLRGRRLGPRVLACAPHDADEDARNALVKAFSRAGAREVLVVPGSLAAAVGAGLDVASPYAQLVLDVGHAVTEGAVIASGEVVTRFSSRHGCGELSTALRRHLLAHHSLRLDDAGAEALVQTVGVREAKRSEYVRVTGRDLQEREKTVWLSRLEAVALIEPLVGSLVARVREGVRALPEELGAQVIESGLVLIGGGARIPGLASRIGEASGLEVRIPEDPVHAVIRGAHGMLRRAAEATGRR